MTITHWLEKLFNPSSIVVIGASGDTRKAGGRFLKGLVDSGYRGTLFAVNPNAGEIFGIRNYRSVLDLPDEIDLAVVSVPSQAVPAVIDQCCQRKVKFAIVHSAGFSELGSEGKGLEREMLRIAGDGGTRIIGPNCMGICVPRARINNIVSGIGIPEAGHVAFIGQSGWITENVLVLGRERGLRFSKIVSIGNQSDLTIEDILEYLGQDEDTHIITIYAEGLKRGRQFLRLVKDIIAKKPIIVWKAGHSPVGARSAASHTGSLAGSGVVFDSLTRQTGMVVTRDLDELLDMMVGFSCPVLPKGNRVSVICETGGGAVSSGDTAEMSGLEVPILSEKAQSKLIETLTGKIPPFAAPRNPVDLVWGPTDNSGALFVECGRIMLAETDCAVMLDYQKFDEALAGQIATLRDEMEKPIFMVPGYVPFARSGMAILASRGIPTFDTPSRAIKVLSEMARYFIQVRSR